MVDVRPRFWGRDVRILMRPPSLPALQFSIANNDDDGLRISFEITRSNAPEPDQAKINVYGLSPITRGKITAIFEVDESFRVEVFAGYKGMRGISELLFLGDVYKFHHRKEGGIEHVTELVAGDGENGFRDGQMHASLASNTTFDTVRRLTEAAMGMVSTVDAQAYFAEALATSNVTTFENGFVATGPAHEILTEVASSVGLKWWIKDNRIVYVPKNRATRTQLAVVLNERTGLLSVGEPKEFGDIEFTSLLNPKIFPGRQVIIQDRFGIPVGRPPWRVDWARYVGDTHGSAWTVNGIARPSLPL